MASQPKGETIKNGDLEDLVPIGSGDSVCSVIDPQEIEYVPQVAG